MLLFPKTNFKYKKNKKKCLPKKYIYKYNPVLHRGKIGLISKSYGFLTPQQLESGRRIASPYVRKGVGQVYIRVFPNISLTKKPNESRMGKGKGNHYKWVYLIKPGTIIYELRGLDKEDAARFLKIITSKLPIKGKIISMEI